MYWEKFWSIWIYCLFWKKIVWVINKFNDSGLESDMRYGVLEVD